MNDLPMLLIYIIATDYVLCLGKVCEETWQLTITLTMNVVGLKAKNILPF